MEEKKQEKVSKKAKKQDVDKLLQLIGVLEPVGVNLKKAMHDGRIDFKDGAYGLALLQELPRFVEAFKAVGEAYEEAKDIDSKEALEIVKKLYEVGAAVERA